MAEQRKKTASNQKSPVASGTKKKSAGGKKTANSRSSASKNAPSRDTVVATRRVYAGLACLALGVIGILSYFNTEAVFLRWARALICGLFGAGYWPAPACLIAAGVLLLRTRHTPFLRQVICVLFAPALVGCIHHVIFAEDLYFGNFFSTVHLLWVNGGQMRAGGVVSGLIGLALKRTLSLAGALIVLLVLAVLMSLFISDTTLADAAEIMQERSAERKARRLERQEEEDDWEDEYEEPEYEDEYEEIGSPERPVDDSWMKALVRNRKKAEPKQSQEKPSKKKKKQEPTKQTPELPCEEPLKLTELPLEDDLVQTPITEMPKARTKPAEDTCDAGAVDDPAQKISSKEAAAARQDVANEAAAAMEQALEVYDYPDVSLLEEPKASSSAGVKEEMAATQAILVDVIESFGIAVKLRDVTRGPSVARFEMELDRGVKLSKLTNLADDIALSLGVSGVRIAPVPDKPSMVGIEVPNRRVNPVPIRSVIESREFQTAKSKISFAVGKDIAGSCVVGDIARLPHLLIAGTTGSGKSVCINSLLVSLLYKASPKEVRLIMVDPKKVELGVYNGIPHLLIPVVTEAKKAAGALQWAVIEMMKRYTEFSEMGVRKLDEYNRMAEKDSDMETLPAIVVVIDELADLMMVAAKEVEESICRIAQLGRAAGIHLVVATQRPSADVITGLMKANIPSRIAFSVASAMESRIIMDSVGAEKLVGKGDMLYHPIGEGKSLRVQGCLISDGEVEAVVNHVKQSSGEVEYDSAIVQQVNVAAANAGGKPAKTSGASDGGDYDELVPDAVDVILETGQASVSMLQRRLKLGYARAARLVDQMEELGYVGSFEGSKPRQVKISKEEWAAVRAEKYGRREDQDAYDMNEAANAEDIPPFDTDEL